MNESKALKYTYNTTRILLALVFFVFGFSYFITPVDKIPMDLSTSSGQFMAALFATGYFLPFLKAVEGIAGFMLFFKRWTPLALLVLAPIAINITLANTLLAPINTVGILMAVVIDAISVFLAWYHFDKYKGLFQA